MQLAARDGIERAERLVHQQDRRIGGERARHANALALTAGELLRPPRRELAGGKPTSASSSSTRAVDPRLVPAEQSRHDGDVVAHASGAETGRRPGARSRCAACRSNGSHAATGRSRDDDLAASGVEQSIDQFEDGALAGAAAPDERQRLALRDLEVEALKHGRAASLQPDTAEGDLGHLSGTNRLRLHEDDVAR